MLRGVTSTVKAKLRDPLSDVISVIIALDAGARRLCSLLNYRPSLANNAIPLSILLLVSLLCLRSSSFDSPRNSSFLFSTDGAIWWAKGWTTTATIFHPRLCTLTYKYINTPLSVRLLTSPLCSPSFSSPWSFLFPLFSLFAFTRFYVSRILHPHEF